MSDAPQHPARHLVRFWPHLSGFLVTAFFALAERQTWHKSLDRPYAGDLGTFFATRLPAPVEYVAVDPAWGGLALALITPMILLHVVKPQWYFAPFAIIGVVIWHVWGSVALGRMG